MKQKTVEITEKDLPLSCPPKGAETNGSHPKIYLKLNDAGVATCQYCGAHYVLSNK